MSISEPVGQTDAVEANRKSIDATLVVASVAVAASVSEALFVYPDGAVVNATTGPVVSTVQVPVTLAPGPLSLTPCTLKVWAPSASPL